MLVSVAAPRRRKEGLVRFICLSCDRIAPPWAEILNQVPEGVGGLYALRCKVHAWGYPINVESPRQHLVSAALQWHSLCQISGGS